MIMNMNMGNIKIILGVKISCYSPFKCKKASTYLKKILVGNQTTYTNLLGVSYKVDSESMVYQRCLTMLILNQHCIRQR